jgi:hypothetical protein
MARVTGWVIGARLLLLSRAIKSWTNSWMSMDEEGRLGL